MAYPPPQQQGYYPPPQGYYPPQTSGTAIFSLVAGIVSWFLCPGMGSIAAIISGHMAKGQIRDSGGRLTGSGMATVGLVLGYGQVAIGCLVLCIYLVLFAGVFGMTLADVGIN